MLADCDSIKLPKICLKESSQLSFCRASNFVERVDSSTQKLLSLNKLNRNAWEILKPESFNLEIDVFCDQSPS